MSLNEKLKKSHKLNTPDVLALLEKAIEKFGPPRSRLINERQGRIDHMLNGNLSCPLETAHIRSSEWVIEPLSENLQDLRFCLLGSANREDLINGLNSPASAYIADMWNLVPQKPKILYRAHRNLIRGVHKTISRLDQDDKKKVQDSSATALIIVPRPFHVQETSVILNDESVPATLYDIIVQCVLNGEALIAQQQAIVFGLRRVFSHLEARWYDSLFSFLEQELNFKRGSIRALVIVDSVECALEMDETLFELRSHSLGMTFDPQRYAVSHIQLFHGDDAEVMPDREMIGLDAPFLKSLGSRLMAIAHKRNAHALFAPGFNLHPSEVDIPIPGYDKMLEEIKIGIHEGFDGAIVTSTKALEDTIDQVGFILSEPNQKSVKRSIESEKAIIERPLGELSTASLIQMVRTALRYRMAELTDKPYAIQGGRKHDRSSMKLALGILKQWRNSSKGIITQSSLPIDDQLLKYLIEKETKKMFGYEEALYTVAQEEAKAILDRICQPFSA